MLFFERNTAREAPAVTTFIANYPKNKELYKGAEAQEN
jgi:hypothetical protein